MSSGQDQISAHLLNHEISWVFNPPSAPNFGPLWEAGVKSVKKHLKHALRDHSFNYEEFNTILIRIESILNSRPLCCLGADPNEGLDVLIPGHFLTGAPVLARPENDISNSYIPPLKRWLLVTQATQCFWKRWRSDYLNTLIQRNKWTSSVNNLKVNDVVIIHNPNCPPQEWPLGIVIKVMPGEDDVVRVVTVRTAHGVQPPSWRYYLWVVPHSPVPTESTWYFFVNNYFLLHIVLFICKDQSNHIQLIKLIFSDSLNF